ncbi:hypothetical protein AvCA_07210 [Azotobacter vinelandii CA]|uniref:Uncharacterized protein n=2 Tax=Azotobacter vinelandii TaxID=354 RepID=C1DLL9_AZOVD|nr:hypothetical protein Avin_07210 [Azotobacter vinelandii DJ]AGK17212.1 hypothetical protein AvCA_07210 [Azotobacter vinelandii CA]AGK19471.1 hypothetical protein AvCA6_07210 [Azotobacter vinelandii CA6]SFX40337.1 hypothetical protein SAMN04244547_01428 [Azotobacter vinelandii]
MASGWIACTLILILTLYFNNLILEVKNEFSRQVDTLRKELHATRTCLDAKHIKSSETEFSRNLQRFEISELPKAQKRLNF